MENDGLYLLVKILPTSSDEDRAGEENSPYHNLLSEHSIPSFSSEHHLAAAAMRGLAISTLPVKWPFVRNREALYESMVEYVKNDENESRPSRNT